MKNFLLTLLPNLTTKAAVTAAVCVTTGAAVTATATTVVYNHKVAEYEKTINEISGEDGTGTGNAGGTNAPGAVAGAPGSATAVRVVDGILEIWDGTQWTDYGSVDDIQSGDPYYDSGNDEKREQLEKSVAAKKLDELGLKINEEGQVVPKTPEEAGGNEVAAVNNKQLPILVGSSINDGKQAAQDNTKKTGDAASDKKKQTAAASTQSTNANTAATAGLTPEQVMAAIQGSGTIASMPMSASSTVTTSTWTASDSGGGGGGGPDPYSPDSGGGDSGGGDSGGSSDSGGGGGSSDSGSSSSDSGSSSSDSGSSNSEPSDSGGFNEGGSDDCGDDVK